MFKSIVVLSLIGIAVVNAAVWQTAGPSVDPKYPDMCYVNRTQSYIPRGQSVEVPESCGKIYCSDELHLRGVSCGVIVYDKTKCVSLGKDLTKPYPECCEKIKCTDGPVSSNSI